MACLIIFYENQSLYTAANQAKLISLVVQTDKANLGGVGTYLPIWSHLLRIQLVTCEPIMTSSESAFGRA
jgi:hypothetical protein